ncbi:DL-endopeptidase inhibitor IseA family protein [Heyndrickxia sporothermodurans]
MIEKGIKKYRFIEYKGKLAQPDADSGSLLDWNKAKGKLIYKKKNVRLFEFSMPLGDLKQTEKIKVTYVKVKNHWLINSIDAVKKIEHSCKICIKNKCASILSAPTSKCFIISYQ